MPAEVLGHKGVFSSRASTSPSPSRSGCIRIRMIIPPLSSLSSSTDELQQGAKQQSRGVEQYYLSTEVSLLVCMVRLREGGCDELGMQ